MTVQKQLILIADDNEDDCELVARVLSSDRFEVRRATTFEQALSILHDENIYMAFVDLYLDENDRLAHGVVIYEQFNAMLPIILMSGYDASKTDTALRQLQQERLSIMSKQMDFDDVSTVSLRMHRQASKTYNGDIAIEFNNDNYSWLALAGKLRNESIQDVDERQLAPELELLVRKLFCEWDQSISPHVKASTLKLDLIPHAGSRTAILRVRPVSETGDAQADVILKIKQSSLPRTEIARQTSDAVEEHPQFERYKNVVGGYGLRERRFARTCRFVGQVYSVPYFRYEETKTYADFFLQERGDADSLTRIEEMTRYVFERCLVHFDGRANSGDSLILSDYYARRINAPRRLRAITSQLPPTTRPMAIKQDELGKWIVPRNGTPLHLVNPVDAVLDKREYRCAAERVITQLRHGDMHANNILVDVERRCCWFIDYESFDLQHFILIDHVELEASILFSLAKLDSNMQVWVSLIDALSQPQLGSIGEVDAAVATAALKLELGKALAAIHVIRDAAQRVNGANSPRPYYHALMYEALRVAGKADAERGHRWHALIAAAILFHKIEDE